MCSLTVRFLIRLYTQQKLRVEWENTFSPEFCVKNGVKQGGVLSPILFTVYFDELLLKLKDSGYGCWIGNTFCGALTYADDVTLLSPTLTSVKLLLKVVESFGEEYFVKFNPSKQSL